MDTFNLSPQNGIQTRNFVLDMFGFWDGPKVVLPGQVPEKD